MALFVNQESNRTELQRRVAAELNEKAKQKAELEKNDRPDGVTDSQYLKDSNEGTNFSWVWILGVLVIIVGLILLIINPS